MSGEIVSLETYQQPEGLTLAAANSRYKKLVGFVQQQMVPDVDYGTIPGCGEKPALFKSGAEKIQTLFGFYSSMECTGKIEDYGGEKTGGEPFFKYDYKCTVRDRAGNVLAQCEGSCNSWEDKYRYRKASRKCPECGAEAIKRSNYPDRQTGEKGWYCHSKAGGCNAKFGANDPAIVNQQAGRIPNPDIFSQLNTIQKMSQKRAFVGSVLIAANASNFFSTNHEVVDPDEIDAEFVATSPPTPSAPFTPVDVEELPPEPQEETPMAHIAAIRSAVGFTPKQCRSVAMHGISETIAVEEFNMEQAQKLGQLMLISYAKKRMVPEQTAWDVLGKILKQNEGLQASDIADMFLVRMEEMQGQVPLTGRAKAHTHKGKSIE